MAKLRQTVELINPDRAFALLENNTKNRNISQRTIDDYAREMKAGRWSLNGEPIIVADTGRILNGQHRLWAVIEAEVELEMAITYGVDESVFDTIDTGKARNASDIFKIGSVKDPALAASAISWIWRYVNDRILSKKYPTPKKGLELFGQCPEVEESYPYARRCKNFIPKGVGAALHFLFSRADREQADVFFEAFASGEFDTGQSSIRACRESIIQRVMKDPKSLPPEERFALIVKAWNAFLAGRDIRVVRFAKAEKFPTIDGLEMKSVKLFRDPQIALRRVRVDRAKIKKVS